MNFDLLYAILLRYVNGLATLALSVQLLRLTGESAAFNAETIADAVLDVVGGMFVVYVMYVHSHAIPTKSVERCAALNLVAMWTIESLFCGYPLGSPVVLIVMFCVIVFITTK